MSAARSFHLLFTTDSSAESMRAAAPVKVLANGLRGRVTLLTVVPELRHAGRGFVAPETVLQKTTEQEIASARRDLEDLRSKHFADVSCEVAVEVAESVAGGVVRHAREQHADMVCMTSHGRSGLSRLLLGSSAEEVLRRSTVPVAVYTDRALKARASEPEMKDTCIVVTTDFSSEAQQAFGIATELSKALGCGVRVVHAVEEMRAIPYGAPLAPPQPSPDSSAAVEAAEKQLAALVAVLPLKPQASDVVIGESIPDAIAGYAHRHHAQLLVVATHGRTGVRRLMMGSVAESILRRSEVPVLLVPIAGT